MLTYFLRWFALAKVRLGFALGLAHGWRGVALVVVPSLWMRKAGCIVCRMPTNSKPVALVIATLRCACDVLWRAAAHAMDDVVPELVL